MSREDFLSFLIGRPFSSPLGNPKESLTASIRFSEIEADLTPIGYEPNIYIKFLAPFLSEERKWKTPIIMHTNRFVCLSPDHH